ncbi:MAG: HDOD domain-containing protein [Caldimonas sp.]
MSLSSNPQAAPIRSALRNLDEWINYFRAIDIPILAKTSLALEVLRESEDTTDANSIGEMIAADPLMTLKVLAYASAHKGRRMVTDTETVTAALVMMGITPFFTAFRSQPSVEGILSAEPDALAGLQRTIHRAHRGADLALGFAVYRMDPDASVIYTVALIHDFAEMLLWCHAPTLQLQIRALQRTNRDLRSKSAQQAVLNINIADMQAALMHAWNLPALLTQIINPTQQQDTRFHTVELATRLARHSADGWDNPAIPNDINDISNLLNISATAAARLVHEL